MGTVLREDGNLLDHLSVKFEGEGPDFDQRSELELGETREKRENALIELKTRLKLITEFEPKVDDDRFLLRFLRARKFDVDRSLALLRSFYGIRLQDVHRYVPMGHGPKDYKELYDLRGLLVLERRNPLDGTAVIILRFGDWIPSSKIQPVDFYSPAVYIAESIANNPEIQLNGLSVVVDLEGLQYSWLVRFATPKYLMRMFGLCQESYPLRIRKLHFINHTAMWNVGFAIAKPFFKAKLRQRYFLHGMDVTTLHDHISREILPEEYGGTAGLMSFAFYDHVYSCHEAIVRDSYYGYDVDELKKKRPKS